jgi:hypothetical protein
MKRMILIVAIALLPVLSACFFGRVRIKPGQTPTLVPEVNKYGALINLKDDKGRRLFKKPIQEGFYVRYRVGCCKEQHVFYAIGNRVSYPKMSYSDYQEKIYGAGVTSKNGLNVTSGFVFDKNKLTIKSIRTVVNLSRETIYLSEVKDYVDTNLLPLRTEIGTTEVAPLPRRGEVAPLPKGDNEAIRLSSAIDPTLIDENCWPCKTWPECVLDNWVPDPTRATVICLDCDKDAVCTGLVHVVCLADLKNERYEYGEEEICEHQITFIGIDARPEKPLNDVACPSPSPESMLATRRGSSEKDVEKVLTLQAGSAIAIITEYKINLPTK